MDPAVITEGTKTLVTQGILGFLLIIAGVVIRFMWNEIKEERKRCFDSQTEIVKIGAETVKINERTAIAIEDRNRITSEMGRTNDTLANAIKHLGDTLTIQNDRVLDFLKVLSDKIQ